MGRPSCPEKGSAKGRADGEERGLTEAWVQPSARNLIGAPAG